MLGRIVTTLMVMVTLFLVVIGNSSASAFEGASFDPKKTYSVVAGSGVIGDPAIFVGLASG